MDNVSFYAFIHRDAWNWELSTYLVDCDTIKLKKYSSYAECGVLFCGSWKVCARHLVYRIARFETCVVQWLLILDQLQYARNGPHAIPFCVQCPAHGKPLVVCNCCDTNANTHECKSNKASFARQPMNALESHLKLEHRSPPLCLRLAIVSRTLTFTQ